MLTVGHLLIKSFQGALAGISALPGFAFVKALLNARGAFTAAPEAIQAARAVGGIVREGGFKSSLAVGTAADILQKVILAGGTLESVAKARAAIEARFVRGGQLNFAQAAALSQLLTLFAAGASQAGGLAGFQRGTIADINAAAAGAQRGLVGFTGLPNVFRGRQNELAMQSLGGAATGLSAFISPFAPLAGASLNFAGNQLSFNDVHVGFAASMVAKHEALSDVVAAQAARFESLKQRLDRVDENRIPRWL